MFEDEKNRLESGVSDQTRDEMSSIGINGIDDVMTGVDISAVFDHAREILSRYAPAPLSALAMLLCVIMIASIAESYTYSLRYTHTKEIMGAAVSLLTVSSVISPIAKLSADSVSVIGGAASLMLIYLPIMAGLLAFSGAAISSAGYYAAVVTGAGALSKLASSVLAPLLNIFLSLAVCSGIGGRIRLNGLIEMIAKAFKWLLTFSVSMFIAVIGMNSALSGAADGLSGKAAKFTLSSLIPMIGSSLADAYQTVRSSLGLLRSGMGVFVILAVMISFAPVLVRALLWTLAVNCAKTAAEAFSVSSAGHIFNALISYLSALRALMIGVLIAFIVSSAVMIRVGGSG